MGRKERKERTRERILESAARLFARNGFMTVTTAGIAAEAGVSHGTVFSHFPTRETLIDAVVQGFSEPLLERVHGASILGNGMLPLLKAHLYALSQDEDLYHRLITEGKLLPRSASDALADINATIAHHFEMAAGAEGCNAINGEPGLAFVYNLWVGMVNHYVMNRELFTPGGSVLGERGEGLAESFHALVLRNRTEDDE